MLRVFIDYRPLDAITMADKYPSLRIDTALDCLEGDAYFTLVDLRSGYYQVAMHPDDKEKQVLSLKMDYFSLTGCLLDWWMHQVRFNDY